MQLLSYWHRREIAIAEWRDRVELIVIPLNQFMTCVTLCSKYLHKNLIRKSVWEALWCWVNVIAWNECDPSDWERYSSNSSNIRMGGSFLFRLNEIKIEITSKGWRKKTWKVYVGMVCTAWKTTQSAAVNWITSTSKSKTSFFVVEMFDSNRPSQR